MTWTTLTFPFESILTSAKMNQLQGNFAAMTGGSASAPRLTNSCFAAKAVDFATIIDDTTSDGSVSVGGSATVDFTQVGVFNVTSTGHIDIYIRCYTGWVFYAAITSGKSWPIISTGDDVRFTEPFTVARTVYWRRMFK